jgi:hypothetical protein
MVHARGLLPNITTNKTQPGRVQFITKLVQFEP